MILQAIVVFILCLKAIFFIKAGSIIASHGVEGSQFSWKYLQSLPISKYELIVFLIISQFLVMLPGIIFFISFQDLILVGLFDVKEYTFLYSLKIICFVVPGLMLITTISIRAQIQAPRKQFAKIHDRKIFLQSIRNKFIYLNLILYLGLAIIFIEKVFNIQIFKTVEELFSIG